MDRFVALDSMPADFAVPPEYADRLVYEAGAHRLHFHGYMSKTDFDRLSGRTRDWAFRRKLEELFQQCVYNDHPESTGRAGLLASLKRRFVHG